MAVSEKAVAAIIDRRLCLFDAITHEGELLFVVIWYANNAEGKKRPEYVLPASKVTHQDMGEDAYPFRYMINDPLPKSLFDGTAGRQERRQYGVCKGPAITYPLDASH